MSMTILTVDDSRTMRDMLKARADRTRAIASSRRSTASTGSRCSSRRRRDVIITDINMPKLDGFGFIESVRRDQRYLGIPILVLTTESSPEKKNLRAARRRHRLDRQAVRPGQAGRRRAARGGLTRSSRTVRMDTMAAIRETFFQECEEQLGELEAGLNAMEEGMADSETVNAVFRAVHSIKGGAGAFKLDRLVRFAHVFETSLDLIRSEQLAPSPSVMKHDAARRPTCSPTCQGVAQRRPGRRGAGRGADRRTEGPVRKRQGSAEPRRTPAAATPTGSISSRSCWRSTISTRPSRRRRRYAIKLHARARPLSQGQRDRPSAARTVAHGRIPRRMRRAARCRRSTPSTPKAPISPGASS